jgi:hypothetical protein
VADVLRKRQRPPPIMTRLVSLIPRLDDDACVAVATTITCRSTQASRSHAESRAKEKERGLLLSLLNV